MSGFLYYVQMIDTESGSEQLQNNNKDGVVFL